MVSDRATWSFLVEAVFTQLYLKSLPPVFLQASENTYRYECPKL